MVDVIYIEREALSYPRASRISASFPAASQVICDRYSEVFNPKSQSFRLQKRNPALILAVKRQGFVTPAPEGHGVGGASNYYFSHMMNCLYDCRYCFLQGMYRSAHYVVFVNYEDFQAEIIACAERGSGQVWFFSGYDCDSLAYEPITGFAAHFVPVFADLKRGWLELRTKSTQVRCLTALSAVPNVVVAFSFTPQSISDTFEHRVPSVEKRIRAMCDLQRQGWKIGLRFDPIIHHPRFKAQYEELFARIFDSLDQSLIHSVTLGAFRMPKTFYRNAVKHYPDEALLAERFVETAGVVTYTADLERRMVGFCRELLSAYIPDRIVYAHPMWGAQG